MEAKFISFIAIFIVIERSTIRAATVEKKTYFSVEHATVEYYNPKYYKYVSMATKRYHRYDPVYYFNLDFHTFQPIGNNVLFSFYFYNEVLRHVYKRTFVEISNKGCDLLMKELIFGAPLKRALQAASPRGLVCPLPAGEYHLQNMTLNTVALPNFPYQSGRIYLNVTLVRNNEHLVSAYTDFQQKQLTFKNTRNKD